MGTFIIRWVLWTLLVMFVITVLVEFEGGAAWAAAGASRETEASAASTARARSLVMRGTCPFRGGSGTAEDGARPEEFRMPNDVRQSQ